MGTPIIPQALLTNAGTYETHLYMVAEALYHRQHPNAKELIKAPAVLRGEFLQLAHVAFTMLTEREGPRWADLRTKAAADYALHRETGRRQDPLRFYQLSREGQ